MCLAGETHDALRVDSDESAAPLLRLAGDEHRLDMAWVHQIDDGAERVADGPEIEAIGLQHDDIGLLTRRERPDPRIEIGAARTLKRREFEHLAAREKRRNVLLVPHPPLQDVQALERERRTHHAEHVLGDRRGVVRAKARAHAVIERILDRGVTVAHGHFERRTLRHAPARVLDQAPCGIVHVRRVDEQVAVAEKSRTTELQERLRLDADVQDGGHIRPACRA
jgi:hypothetical protein